jgi:hypothetical protein
MPTTIMWFGTSILEPSSKRIQILAHKFGHISVQFPEATDGFCKFDEITVGMLIENNVDIIATDTDVPEDWTPFFSNPKLRDVKILKWNGEDWESINPYK